MSEHDENAARDPRLFEMAGRVVTAREVILAADVRGALEPSWRGFLAGVRALEVAVGRHLEPDADELQNRMDEFRSDRGLITADETMRWLEARGLGADDLEAYVLRDHWRERIEAPAAPEGGGVHGSTPELRDLFHADLMISGGMLRLARDLASRAAVFEGLGRDALPRREAVEAERAAFLERNGLDEASLSAWRELAGCSPERLEELLAMEAAFRLDCGAALTPKARERTRHALRLPLTRVEVETLEVESLDAAREAVLCLREDGLSMEGLAGENRYPYSRATFLLEDLDDDLRVSFLSAAPGDVVGPLGVGEGIRVHRLVGKREPDPSDPDVLERIDRTILRAHHAERTAKCVRWLVRDEAGE